MSKYLELTVLLIVIFGLASCNIRTPEINGVVLDAETEQPVEGAWVTATLGIKTRTISGDVHKYLSVEQPHTKTGKMGRFTIPARSFKTTPFLSGFGTDAKSLGVGASTADDKGGSIDLLKFLGKKKAEVTVYIKPEERTEDEYRSHLKALYNYCFTGRFFVEVPPVEGGCDEWELNYVITKHERYLEKYKGPKIIEQPPYGVSKWDKIHKYSAVLKDLAYLHEKKGDYKKALILFKRAKDFDEKHDSSFSTKEYENQIKKLQQKIQ
jgi:hypothetical protein